MKKTYEKPSVEVIEFTVSDICKISLVPGGPGGDIDDPGIEW